MKIVRVMTSPGPSNSEWPQRKPCKIMIARKAAQVPLPGMPKSSVGSSAPSIMALLEDSVATNPLGFPLPKVS